MKLSYIDFVINVSLIVVTGENILLKNLASFLSK